MFKLDEKKISNFFVVDCVQLKSFTKNMNATKMTEKKVCSALDNNSMEMNYWSGPLKLLPCFTTGLGLKLWFFPWWDWFLCSSQYSLLSMITTLMWNWLWSTTITLLFSTIRKVRNAYNSFPVKVRKWLELVKRAPFLTLSLIMSPAFNDKVQVFDRFSKCSSSPVENRRRLLLFFSTWICNP